MPLVVAPRFNPPPIVQTVDFQPGSNGWGQTADPVPDRREISPPVLDPDTTAPTNPVALKVTVNAGCEIAELKSHHHEISIEDVGEGGQVKVVMLKAGAVPADRDFELTWMPKAQAVPSVGVFKERVDGKDYVLAFVTPPTHDVLPGITQQEEAAGQDVSGEADGVLREVVFVIDNSGSMGGASIRQAKQALQMALERLRPEDRFNVIRFDDTFDVAFSRSIEASKSNLQRARRFVSSLEASGGTMMVAPMEAALRDRGAARTGEIRQVVFLTDGAIGNEAELLSLVGARRGRSRVFMVGIGSAPNSALMSQIAEAGRGTFTHIGSTEQISERMAQLFEKLESPVVTGLAHSLDVSGADVTLQGRAGRHRDAA